MPIDEGARLGRYEIRSKIGEGGMGEVYLAQDTKLDRKVALKILPADVAGDHNRMRRFEREARAASALNHPNIITIHEFGEIYSTHYLVTEFIDGETLRARLTRERLKPDEALDVAQQAAFALTAAHAAGIAHRDIKPENIMLRRDGIVKVLDFGLAKLAEERRPSMIDTQADTLVRTDSGTVMGTAAYMSPEQARGLELDARTDIWSLGVVMYEMVTGRPPFKGETQSHIVVSILEHEPPLLAKFAPATPAELQRIVRKALTKDRDNRYQTVRDLMIDLRALRRDLDLQSEIERSAAPQAGTPDVIVPSTHAPIETYFRDYGAPTQAVSDAAATNDTRTQPTISAEYLVTEIRRHKLVTSVVLAVLAGIIALAAYLHSANTEAAIDSIAILPFVNESKDPNAEYLSDGISDSIINRLSQLSNLRVASLSSALRYKGQAVDPLAVGRDLKVRAVLIGWMTKRGDELSFRTELVDVRDNHRIWGEQYNNRQLADLLQVQEQISRDISEKLRLRLSGEEQQRLAKAETKNSEAYQFYLRGRYYWNKYTEEGFRKSIEYFKQAVDKDPSYALAYSGLADSYSVMGDLSYATPKEAYPQADEYAKKALAFDDDLPQAHMSLGIVKMFYDWDWSGAEKELRRAKELNPNYPDVYHFYGHYFEIVGQTDQGIVETKRGVELDPTSLIINAELGLAYCMAGQSDSTISQGRKTLELDNNFFYGSWIVAIGYEQAGRYREAVTELNRARPISADWSFIIADLAYSYARIGERAEAQKLLQQLKDRAARGEFIDPFLIAYVYAGLGDKDQAFAWLEKAYQERGNICWLKVDPHFDLIRKDPRFTDLLRRMGLPP